MFFNDNKVKLFFLIVIKKWIIVIICDVLSKIVERIRMLGYKSYYVFIVW